MAFVKSVPEIGAHEILDNDVGVGFGSLLPLRGFVLRLLESLLILLPFFLFVEEFVDVLVMLGGHLIHNLTINRVVGKVGLRGIMFEEFLRMLFVGLF